MSVRHDKIQAERESIDKDHLLIKSFFKDSSLVQSNLDSFNDFLGGKMQEIVNDINSLATPIDDFDIKLGKISIGKPIIKEADGSGPPITPAEARIRGITYAAPLFVELTVKYDNQVESSEVELGRIPVLVKSKACNLYGLSKEELIERDEDPMDFGGYFLINGNERVIVMGEDLASNQPFFENNSLRGLMLRILSQRGAYKIPVSVIENKEGILEVSFSRFRKLPLVILLKALGVISEQEIFKLVGHENDGMIVNLSEYGSIGTVEDAMLKIAEINSLQGTKKEILDRVKQRLDSYLLPHIGLDKSARIEKARTLARLVKQFYMVKANPSLQLGDKDHYANKRIRLSGDLLADLFRVNLNSLIREVQHSLQKTVKRRKLFSIKSLAKSTLFSQRIESAIATGSWIGERTGVTQNMKKDNSFARISQLQKIVSSLAGEQEHLAARTVHPTHYGRFCPIETPEGTEIGLRKNLAMLAKVSTRSGLSEEKLLQSLVQSGLKRDSLDGTDVFLNGKFIGTVESSMDFFKSVREKRRRQELSEELSIKQDFLLENIVISTEIGRVLRPLIIADEGVPRVNESHLEKIRSGELTWNSLVTQGLVEYIDAAEEDNALVALYPAELTKDHDYLEIDQIACLGILTSIVPYANHDQAPRLLRGSKTKTQSLGIYAANYPLRIDTNVSILSYPQKPLARSFIYDEIEAYPAGQNVVVAVLPFEGYNIEDAIVLNKASVDRGLARSTYFKPYSSLEINYAGRLKDDICIPEKDVSGYRSEESYKYLEDDGIVYPEAELNEGDVVIGRVSPPKFLSDMREISIQSKKENSTAVKQAENGIADGVFITQDEDGNKSVRVRLRDIRRPEVGDKFSTPHGQKGVIGLLAEDADVPFSINGIKPDLIFNPHGIPSRMTAGYLLEVLASKVASVSGSISDASAFSGTELGTLEENLEKVGFRYDGKETMYNGITGKKMTVKIFIGTMYYLKLERMVKNLLHARASGKIALLTRQPIEGRARGGGLRLGEMEQQALVAHGASLLLKERYDSDKVVVHICEKCGSLAVDDQIRKKIYCPICQSKHVEPVEVSYAFKLLVEELQGMHILTKFNLKNKYE